jgi:hypothetical protein
MDDVEVGFLDLEDVVDLVLDLDIEDIVLVTVRRLLSKYILDRIEKYRINQGNNTAASVDNWTSGSSDENVTDTSAGISGSIYVSAAGLSSQHLRIRRFVPQKKLGQLSGRQYFQSF